MCGSRLVGGASAASVRLLRSSGTFGAISIVEFLVGRVGWAAWIAVSDPLYRSQSAEGQGCAVARIEVYRDYPLRATKYTCGSGTLLNITGVGKTHVPSLFVSMAFQQPCALKTTHYLSPWCRLLFE